MEDGIVYVVIWYQKGWGGPGFEYFKTKSDALDFVSKMDKGKLISYVIHENKPCPVTKL